MITGGNGSGNNNNNNGTLPQTGTVATTFGFVGLVPIATGLVVATKKRK